MSDIEIPKNSATNGKASASRILGILSIVCVILSHLGLMLGVVGLVIGIIGLRETKQLKQDGKRAAISGIVYSSFGVLLTITLAVFGYGSY